MKDAANRGDQDTCKIHAKTILSSRKTKSQISTAKAQMHSIELQIQEQLSMLKVTGAIQKSAGIMTALNKSMNITLISSKMQDLAKEMTKAGIIEEIVNDTFEQMEPEDLDADAEEEVDKVIFEITSGILKDSKQATTQLTDDNLIARFNSLNN